MSSNFFYVVVQITYQTFYGIFLEQSIYHCCLLFFLQKIFLFVVIPIQPFPSLFLPPFQPSNEKFIRSFIKYAGLCMHVWETKRADNNLISSTFLPYVSSFFQKSTKRRKRNAATSCFPFFPIFCQKIFPFFQSTCCQQSYMSEERKKGVRMSQMVEWNKAFHFMTVVGARISRRAHIKASQRIKKTFQYDHRYIIIFFVCLSTSHQYAFMYLWHECAIRETFFHFLQVL